MLLSSVVTALVLASLVAGSPVPGTTAKAVNPAGGKTRSNTKVASGPKTKTNSAGTVTTTGVSPGGEGNGNHTTATDDSKGGGFDIPTELPSNPFSGDSPSATHCELPKPTHSSSNQSWTEGITMVSTDVAYYGNNITIGGLWPEDCPGPADLFVQGIRELCNGPHSGPHRPNRWILKDLDVSVSVVSQRLDSFEDFKHLNILLDDFVRASSYWSNEAYDIVDYVGEPKEGGVPITRVTHKRDWFVTTPVGWSFRITKRDNANAAGGAATILTVQLSATWHDPGMGSVCSALETAMGVVNMGLDRLPGAGGAMSSFLGPLTALACNIGKALEPEVPKPSPC